MIKFPLLEPQDIEVKPKQIGKSGALFFLYKTSRTDAKFLDQAVSPMNWCSEYKMIGDQLYCGIGVRESEDQPFVWKWDCGIALSSDQNDENRYKAQSSDAMKRSCSRWGIGSELYTSPQVWANVMTKEAGGKWVLSDPQAKYVVTEIKYDSPTRTITKLVICNAKTGVSVFSWEMPTTETMKKKMNKISANRADEQAVSPAPTPVEKTEEPTPTQAPTEKTEESAPTNNADKEKKPLKVLVKEIGLMVKVMRIKEGGQDKYLEITKGFKCNSATEADYDRVLEIHGKLIAAGYNA